MDETWIEDGVARKPWARRAVRRNEPPRPGCSANRHDDATSYERYGCVCEAARRQARGNSKRRALGIQPPGVVDATGCRRRLQAMMTVGRSLRAVAVELGMHEVHVRRIANGTTVAVLRRTAGAVAVLYDRWWDQWGGSARATSWARRHGYAPPQAWRSNTQIDDPAATPSWFTMPRPIGRSA